MVWKPSIADPTGESPVRPRLAASRNRVLRGERVTAAAKRTQGACEPKRLSLDREQIPEPTWFSERKATLSTMYWPVVDGPAGSKSKACTHRGLYGNLGDLALSFEQKRCGRRYPPAPAERVVSDAHRSE